MDLFTYGKDDVADGRLQKVEDCRKMWRRQIVGLSVTASSKG